MNYNLNDVYITGTGAYLPGTPIDNEKIEHKLGLVAGKASRYRHKILQSNGIKKRHYAIDDNGNPNELSEEMAVKAIAQALAASQLEEKEIDMIAAGTTMPDLLVPGFASMIHGRLGGQPMDILSCAGVCGAGIAALKAASHTIRVGQHNNVVSVAAERPSAFMRGTLFDKYAQAKNEHNDKANGYDYFSAEFLRWMLSDGAGAFVLQNKPATTHTSLKIEWIETISFANELDTCMYLGAQTTRDYNVKSSWLWENSKALAEKKGKLLLRQDVKLLSEHIVSTTVRALKHLSEKGYLSPDQIDHFLPHISSYFFYEKLAEEMHLREVAIPCEKWFTNLENCGNTGSASIYIMLDEALRRGRFIDSDSVLLMVPESGRFSVSYILLTVVANDNT